MLDHQTKVLIENHAKQEFERQFGSSSETVVTREHFNGEEVIAVSNSVKKAFYKNRDIPYLDLILIKVIDLIEPE